MVSASGPPLVVIGGSAGSIAPLRRILGELPQDLPAAVCVVIHLPDGSPSGLARVLSGVGPLNATFAEDGDELRAGSVFVAPPGHHLLVRDGRLALSHGARENGSRPAIDPLFRTAAHTAGSRTVSVLLSGTLDDGAAGTSSIRRAGGLTIVQDPEDAEFADMPRHAMATGAVARMLPASRIADEVNEAVALMASPNGRLADDPQGEGVARSSTERGLSGPAGDLQGTASPYSCPACGGVLYERHDQQFLCRLGHRYSPDALSHEQEAVVEDALWTALRTLNESASLAARVRDRAAARGDRDMEGRFEGRRREAHDRAERIRVLLKAGAGEPLDEELDTAAAQSTGDGHAL